MPYSKVRSATGGLNTLAQTVAVPRDHRPIRIPSFPALERTGVLAFTDTITHTVPTASKSYAMVCRDPAYPVWIQKSLGAASFYTPVCYTPGFTLASVALQYIDLPVPENPTSFFCNGNNSITGTGQAPIIKYEGRTFIPGVCSYCSLGIELDVTVATTNPAFKIGYEYINAEGDIVAANLTQVSPSMAGTSIGMVVSLPQGAIAVRLTSLAVKLDTVTTIAVACWGTTSWNANNAGPLKNPATTTELTLWPAVTPPEISTTTVPWKSVRANSVAALFSNVTAVLNKEGTVTAARIPSEQYNVLTNHLMDTIISKTHPKDRYFGALENGLYTYTLPDANTDTFRDVTPLDPNVTSPPFVGGTQVIPCSFYYDCLAYANMIIFSDLGGDATTLAITVDRHIEFRTNSVLFPVGYSPLGLEEYHMSQMALVQMGVFFENPVHLAAIGAMVRSAIAGVARYALPAAKEVGKAALAAAGDKLVSMARAKLGTMNQAGFKANKPKPKPKPKAKARTSKQSAARRRR